jgi:mannose-1-phosphate guanylyltransferase / mannose-6-phosphate isomerase
MWVAGMPIASVNSADEAGKRISGQGLSFESTKTYINSPHRPVVALGSSSLVIFDTSDAVLVVSADNVE